MKRRGIGFASGWQGVNYHFGHPDVSTVNLELTDDLHYRVGVAAADLGQGVPETLATIISEVFGGVPREQIKFVDPDTAVTPDGGATGASRHTAITGNAALLAARRLAEVLKTAASEMLDTPPDEITIREGTFFGREGAAVTLAEVVRECRRIGLSLSTTGRFVAPPTEPLDERGQGYGVNDFGYATYIAEVEVDSETGELKVLRLAAFVDAGRIVRRMGAEMQVEGGAAMALGFALSEEFKQREGWPQTDGFTTYLIPTVWDVPLEITSSFVDKPVPMGDLGAKGMAELVLVPVIPAIINAIYDAVGARVTELPATPERVLMAIKARETEKDAGGQNG